MYVYTEFLPCLQNPGRPLPAAQSLGDGRAVVLVPGPALILTLARYSITWIPRPHPQEGTTILVGPSGTQNLYYQKRPWQFC